MSADFDPYYKWLAIPPDEQPPDDYRLIGVRQYEDDPDVIENAIDQRMKHLRSFQAGQHSAASQKLLNELSKARVRLLAAEKKKEYDKQLHNEDAEQEAAKQPPPPPSKVVEEEIEIVDSEIVAGEVIETEIVDAEMIDTVDPKFDPLNDEPDLFAEALQIEQQQLTQFPAPNPYQQVPQQPTNPYAQPSANPYVQKPGAPQQSANPYVQNPPASQPVSPQPPAPQQPAPQQPAPQGATPTQQPPASQRPDAQTKPEPKQVTEVKAKPAQQPKPTEPKQKEAKPATRLKALEPKREQPTREKPTPAPHLTPIEPMREEAKPAPNPQPATPKQRPANQPTAEAPKTTQPTAKPQPQTPPAQAKQPKTQPRPTPQQLQKPQKPQVAQPKPQPTALQPVQSQKAVQPQLPPVTPQPQAAASPQPTAAAKPASAPKPASTKSRSKLPFIAVCCVALVAAVTGAILVIPKLAGEDDPAAETTDDTQKTDDDSDETPPATTGVQNANTRDLLSEFSPLRGVAIGDIRQEDGVLVTSAGTPDIAQFPTAIPSDYNLTVEVTRTGKSQAVFVGLVARGRQFMVTIDGFPELGARSGLERVDGRRIDKSDVQVQRGEILKRGQATTISCTVRGESIVVECAGQRIVDWNDSLSRLSLPPEFGVRNRRAFFVGSWDGIFEISKVLMTPLRSGSPRPAPETPVTPSTPVEEPPIVETPVDKPPQAPLIDPDLHVWRYRRGSAGGEFRRTGNEWRDVLADNAPVFEETANTGDYVQVGNGDGRLRLTRDHLWMIRRNPRTRRMEFRPTVPGRWETHDGQPAPINSSSLPITGPAALRFIGLDSVELADTKALIDLDDGFTVELWLRVTDNSFNYRIVGTHVRGQDHEDLEDRLTAGWRLYWLCPHVVTSPSRVSGYWGRSFKLGTIRGRGEGWHHLAMSSDREMVRCFIDGDMIWENEVSAFREKAVASPLNITLGSNQHGDMQSAEGLHADIKAFRISSAGRYTANFQPPDEFNDDPATEVLLDFSKPGGDTIQDFSGNDRHGTIHGAKWVSANAPLPLPEFRDAP